MAKFYTDIRQSKRLQEIGLSANTADLSLYCIDKDYKDYLNSGFTLELEPYSEYEGIYGYHPAWSLPKLLELLPHAIQDFHPYKAWGLNMSLRYGSLQYVTDNFDDVKETKIFWDINGTEIIDALVDMAVWLAENGYVWKNGEFRNIKENKDKRYEK